jgi:CheY-like chemotaxis protein
MKLKPMQKTLLNCCYFPTTTLLIDDNPRFLENLTLAFELNHISCKSFSHPELLLNYLATHKQQSNINRALNWIEEEDFDHRTIDLNIQNIYQEIYNPKRFSEISVIIADYAMHGMDGLELLQKIKLPNVKKILLTGEADEKLAVEAFNNNIIDAFILKDTINLLSVITNRIQTLQKQYFANLSNFALKFITDDPTRHSCLNDPIFTKFFLDYFHNNNFSEYYLLDESGSFLLLNATGEATIFAVNTDKNFAYYNSYINNADDASLIAKETINALSTKNKILFINPRNATEITPANWDKHLYAARILEGQKKYYYAIIKSDIMEVKNTQILAYKDFLGAANVKD